MGFWDQINHTTLEQLVTNHRDELAQLREDLQQETNEYLEMILSDYRYRPLHLRAIAAKQLLTERTAQLA